MQVLMTMVSIVAGMAFSLAFAVLVEELIFGKVFGLVLAPHTQARAEAQKFQAAVSNK